MSRPPMGGLFYEDPDTGLTYMWDGKRWRYVAPPPDPFGATVLWAVGFLIGLGILIAYWVAG